MAGLVRSVAGAVCRARGGQKKNEAHPTSLLLPVCLNEAASHLWVAEGLLEAVPCTRIGVPTPHSGPPVCTSKSANNQGLPTCAGSFESRSFRWQACRQQRIGTGTAVQRISSGAIHVEEQRWHALVQNHHGAGARGLFCSPFKKRAGEKGYKIGKYVLQTLLGVGAFAKVFVAKNSETKEQVAVKIFDRAHIMGSQGTKLKPSGHMKLLMSEIAAMMAVRHPYIVRLHEVLGDRNYIYLVMEYLPGGTLFQKMQAGQGLRGGPTMVEEQARKYFQQLMDAVGFCHRKGVFHRDLKPENLLLDAWGSLKVADFGLSGITHDATRVGNLTFGTVAGTAGYMAPEVIRSQYGPLNRYSGATADIWSCGVILFVLLCGHEPFDTADSQVTHRILTASYSIPTHVPVSARKLINKMLDPRVATRITAEGVHSNDWFKIGYTPPDFTQIQEVATSLRAVEAAFDQKQMQASPDVDSPATLSAFHLLSQSAPVDLSTLVQRRPGDSGMMEETRLTSKLPATHILRQIQAAAMPMGFTVQIRGFKMKLVAQESSPRPIICVVGEVFEVPGAGMCMVILRKVTGDSQDYDKFSTMLCNAVKDTMVELKTRP